MMSTKLLCACAYFCSKGTQGVGTTASLDLVVDSIACLLEAWHSGECQVREEGITRILHADQPIRL